MTDISIKKFSIFNKQHLIHANSTRNGGVSKGVFKSLNLGLHTADKSEHVKQNRSVYFNYLGVSQENLVFAEQVHSDTITIVTRPGIVSKTDSLITATRGIFLTIQTADCFPVFIFDPVKKVCALVHSGWKGTAENIVGKTIQKIIATFGSVATELLIAIGAGIQQRNYQVDKKTAMHFNRSFLNEDGKDHFKLDIQAAIVHQIRQSGIPDKHIETDTDCTFEHEELYYSHRRDGKNSGRMMAVMGLPG